MVKNRYIVSIIIIILSYLFVHYSKILVPKQQMKAGFKSQMQL